MTIFEAIIDYLFNPKKKCNHDYEIIIINYTQMGRPYLETIKCSKCNTQIDKVIK